MACSADDGGSRSADGIFEIVVLTVPQQRRLNTLRDHHHEIGVHIGRGPCGSLEATVTDDGWPPEHHIFGRDAEEMLAKVERAVEGEPDTG